MSISIRELGIQDRLMLEELLDVCGPGWSDHLAPGASGPMAFIADPRSFVFGAYIDNEVVGWLWGAHMWRPDGRMMSYVHEVDVVADHRRKGVATSLVEAAIGLARRNESHAMWLLTDTTNEPAKALYEATGGARLREDGHDLAFVWRF
jgi:ribosomal protein S18 acetylase RimI-like enzyme